MNAANPAQPTQNPWLQVLISAWDRIVNIFRFYIGILFGIPVWTAGGISHVSENRWVRIGAAIFAGVVLLLVGTALIITLCVAAAVMDSGPGPTTWMWLVRAAILNLLAMALLGFLRPLKLAYLAIKLTKSLMVDGAVRLTENTAKYAAETLGVAYDSFMGLIKAVGVIAPWDISKDAFTLGRPEFKAPDTTPIMETVDPVWKEIVDEVASWGKSVNIYFLFNLIVQSLGVFLLLFASGQTAKLFAVWSVFIVLCVAWKITVEKLNYRPAAKLAGWIGGIGLVILLVADISGGNAWVKTWAKEATAISKIEHRREDQRLAILTSFQEAELDSGAHAYMIKSVPDHGLEIVMDSTRKMPKVMRVFIKPEKVIYLINSEGTPVQTMVNLEPFTFIVLLGEGGRPDPRTACAVPYADLKISKPNI